MASARPSYKHSGPGAKAQALHISAGSKALLNTHLNRLSIARADRATDALPQGIGTSFYKKSMSAAVLPRQSLGPFRKFLTAAMPRYQFLIYKACARLPYVFSAMWNLCLSYVAFKKQFVVR